MLCFDTTQLERSLRLGDSECSLEEEEAADPREAKSSDHVQGIFQKTRHNDEKAYLDL